MLLMVTHLLGIPIVEKGLSLGDMLCWGNFVLDGSSFAKVALSLKQYQGTPCSGSCH